MRLDELSEHVADQRDAIRALTIASGLEGVLRTETPAVAGAALGLALGEWVKAYGPNLTDQERAIDRVLAICARTSRAK
jgi:hypothetical protein